MLARLPSLFAMATLIALAGCAEHPSATVAVSPPHQAQEQPVGDKLTLTDEQWKARLTPEQYQVLRRKGTEPAFCGGYTATKDQGVGIYHCAGCDAPLFTSDTKFNSGTGWPSFFQALPGRVGEHEDSSYGMVRTEVVCARCDGHLGHLFEDGPRPTGLRFCINAVCLRFAPGEKPEVAPAK